MDRIYSTAQRTIIWLGDFRHDITNSASEEERSHTARRISSSRMLASPHVFLKRLGRQETDPSVCLLRRFSGEMLIETLISPYWWRVWIIQEIVLASKASVLLEGSVWDLEDLHFVLATLTNNIDCPEMKSWKGVISQLEALKERLRFFRAARLSQRLTLDSEAQGRKPKILITWDAVLALSLGTNCTIPIDRVYAMMGFLPKGLRFHPDYTMTHNEVLSNVLQKQISLPGNCAGGIWETLDLILKFWEGNISSEYVRPAGTISEPHFNLGSELDYSRLTEITEHNIRLVLKDFSLPVPVEPSNAYRRLCHGV